MQADRPQVELDVDLDESELQSAGLLQLFSPTELQRVVERTLQEAGVTQSITLSLLITGDATIQSLNREYRGQDKPTDVLSFPLLDKPLVHAPRDQLWTSPASQEASAQSAAEQTPVFVTPPGLPIHLGDIVISWPTTLRQANAAGTSPHYELLYLLSHGVLHLVGYDDVSEAGYQAMVQLQRSILDAMGQKAQLG